MGKVWGSNELFANQIIRGTFPVRFRVAIRVEYTLRKLLVVGFGVVVLFKLGSGLTLNSSD
jgi:hypothetical protein